MAHILKLFPGGEVTATLTDLDKVLEWVKLSPDTFKQVATKVGDENLKDFFIIVAIAPGEWRDAMGDLSGVERAQVNLAVNFIRHAQGIEVVDLVGPPLPAGPAPSTGTLAAPVAAKEPGAQPALPDGVAKNAIKVSHVFDQGCRLEVLPIDPQEVTSMRARWQSPTGLKPSKHLNPSDNQLSVLKRLRDVDHSMLAFDMGVWGPYGARRERHFMLTMHHLNAAGAYQAKEVPGAQTLDDWLQGWAFATTGFVMGDIVERGVADAYAENFKKMANNYPNAWWVCCMAEWEFRYEFAVEEVARQRQFFEQNPTLSRYDPKMPWNSVLLAGVKGMDAMQFWEDTLKEKARNWMTTQRANTHPSWCSRQASLYSPPADGDSHFRGAAAPGAAAAAGWHRKEGAETQGGGSSGSSGATAWPARRRQRGSCCGRQRPPRGRSLLHVDRGHRALLPMGLES